MEHFIKYNHSNYSDQLICEAHDLKALAQQTSSLKIPQIMDSTESQLTLEYIPGRYFTDEAYIQLATGLAQLHQNQGTSFGLDYNNYIGLNPQKNTCHNNWGEFFWEYRLLPQAEILRSSKLQSDIIAILSQYKAAICDFLNEHNPHPAPLHGDLWHGNILYNGEAIFLIDPAFYYGDHEVDLAMTEMFGRFNSKFYKIYNEQFPLSSNYSKRKIIYNLYHYLNHYNLFGPSYLSGIQEGLNFIKKL